MADTNWLLREHVLRTGFSLVLTKTQIAALCELDAAIERNHWMRLDELSATWRTFHANWTNGVHGLERRGLVRHTFHENAHKYPRAGDMPVGEAWQVTEAGRLTIGLLKEAGLYQHYQAAMPAEAGP
jgi:hypothetical protein